MNPGTEQGKSEGGGDRYKPGYVQDMWGENLREAMTNDIVRWFPDVVWVGEPDYRLPSQVPQLYCILQK